MKLKLEIFLFIFLFSILLPASSTIIRPLPYTCTDIIGVPVRVMSDNTLMSDTNGQIAVSYYELLTPTIVLDASLLTTLPSSSVEFIFYMNAATKNWGIQDI